MELPVRDHQEQIGGTDHTRRAWFYWRHCLSNATIGASNRREGLLLRMVLNIISVMNWILLNLL